MTGIETWAEMHARQMRERVELAQSVSCFTLPDAAKILDMRADTLRGFCKYHGITFKKRKGYTNAKETIGGRSGAANVSAQPSGQMGDGSVQHRPSAKCAEQLGNSATGTEMVHEQSSQAGVQRLTKEDIYRQLLERQLAKDVKKNPNMKPKPIQTRNVMQDYGKQGGRPRKTANGVDLRQIIATASDSGMTVEQIASMCKCDKSTVRRIMGAMMG